MLIVGGSAALTAIFVYLAWHFFRQWRSSLRRRRAAIGRAITEARSERRHLREARGLDLAR
ncbi:MAG TPA: hypothetical protein VFO09_05885 [Methyloceanibacter sp.]|jgi:hypothetical protein|nr:hypothetical protein [Methyloceanibacter sp.]